MEATWLADEHLVAQARANPIENFRLVFDDAFIKSIVGRMDDNADIFRKILDDRRVPGGGDGPLPPAGVRTGTRAGDEWGHVIERSREVQAGEQDRASPSHPQAQIQGQPACYRRVEKIHLQAGS